MSSKDRIRERSPRNANQCATGHHPHLSASAGSKWKLIGFSWVQSCWFFTVMTITCYMYVQVNLTCNFKQNFVTIAPISLRHNSAYILRHTVPRSLCRNSTYVTWLQQYLCHFGKRYTYLVTHCLFIVISNIWNSYFSLPTRLARAPPPLLL